MSTATLPLEEATSERDPFILATIAEMQAFPSAEAAALSHDAAAVAEATMCGSGADYHRVVIANECRPHQSQSEVDAAAACLFARYTRDPDVITQLLRENLPRPKLDANRSYVEKTVTWALSQVRKSDTRAAWVKLKERLDKDDTSPSAREGGAVVRSLEDFMQNPDAMRPPTAVVPRLAWAGRVTLFASSEGWGKSTMARAGAAAVTTGQPFLDGAAAPPGIVLWARLEESEYDTMINANRFGADRSRFLVWTPGADPVRELIAAIREHRPALTVVDSIQELAVLAGVENLDDAGQMGRALFDVVRTGRDLNTAMLWLSQGAKATGRYRNSSWLGHTADAVIEIKEPKPDDPVRELIIRKKRMDVFGYRVELVNGCYRLVSGQPSEATAQPSKLRGERKKVLAALRPGMRYAEWRDAYHGNANTFDFEVKQLRKLNLARQDAELGTWTADLFTVDQELAA